MTNTVEVPDATEKEVLSAIAQTAPPIQNWKEWLVRLTWATSSQERESLLHIGFTVSLEPVGYREKRYGEADRIRTYLAIADGWADSNIKLREEEPKYVVDQDRNGNITRKTSSELRKQLACKAFNMLALNFFNLELWDGDREFRWQWEKVILSEELFPVIRNFFRPEKEQFGNDMVIRNLSRSREPSHNEERARNFLLNLAEFLWKWKEPNYRYISADKEARQKYLEYLAEMRSRIESAKPWMVEVLANLQRLDALEEFILELNGSCLAKLEEIALRAHLNQFRHPVNESRRVLSVEEACYAGSKAAWLLLKQRLKARVHSKLVAVRDAERNKAEAERALEELSIKQ